MHRLGGDDKVAGDKGRRLTVLPLAIPFVNRIAAIGRLIPQILFVAS
jgi:hypothetical protein